LIVKELRLSGEQAALRALVRLLRALLVSPRTLDARSHKGAFVGRELLRPLNQPTLGSVKLQAAE
jgi:hypothetical protein